MERVALYVRVSTEEQKLNGLSVDNQIEALQEYAKDNNYIVVGVYNDAGISARKSYKKRPALLKLLEDCEAKKVDLILFTKLDRWFRSIADYYEVQRVLDNNKIPWKAIWEDYETITSSGVFKVNIMLSVAQSEADRTSERIKAVFEYKRARGEALTGVAPTGYVYKEGKCYKDEKTREGVEAFFDTYLKTLNKKMAIRKARDLGVRISDETARNMLYSDRYNGSVPYIVESYVTMEQYEYIMANKPKCERHNKYSYVFSGLVKCGKCGRLLSASTSVSVRKSGKVAKTAMYVCDYGRRNYDCEGSAISEVKLEKIILDTLEDELNNYNISLTHKNQNNIADKLKASKDRLNRLKIMFELGDIDVEEYKAKRNSLLSEIETYQAFEIKEPILLDESWKDIYNSLDTKHKNSFWRQIIDVITVPEKRATSVNISFK